MSIDRVATERDTIIFVLNAVRERSIADREAAQKMIKERDQIISKRNAQYLDEAQIIAGLAAENQRLRIGIIEMEQELNSKGLEALQVLLEYFAEI